MAASYTQCQSRLRSRSCKDVRSSLHLPVRPARSCHSKVLGAGSRKVAISGLLWCGCALTKRRSSKLRSHACRVTSSLGTELIVDADSHSQYEIEWVLQALQAESDKPVLVTIFSVSGRKRSAKWRKFMKQQNVKLHSVSPIGGNEDPTDQQILAYAGQRVARFPACRLALLTCDTDFIDLCVTISMTEIEVLVYISYVNVSAIRRYESAGVRVVPVPREEPLTYTVAAVLHPDGSGSVQRCKPFPREHMNPEHLHVLHQTMEELDYWSAQSSKLPPLAPCIAKCWFASGLGKLTVYPTQCAMRDMYSAIVEEPRDLQPNRHNLAYLFPLRKVGGRAFSKSKRRQFGSSMAWAVAKSGGPFMLEDSDDLSMEALRRLGYLLHDFEANPLEALLVFWNMKQNKAALLRMGKMPTTADSVTSLSAKLRLAFLSQECDGHWQTAPGDTEIRRVLKSQHYLDSDASCREEVFTAMGKYAADQGLPKMRTYLGRIWQMLLRMHPSDPSRRDVIWPAGLM